MFVLSLISGGMVLMSLNARFALSILGWQMKRGYSCSLLLLQAKAPLLLRRICAQFERESGRSANLFVLSGRLLSLEQFPMFSGSLSRAFVSRISSYKSEASQILLSIDARAFLQRSRTRSFFIWLKLMGQCSILLPEKSNTAML